MANEFYALMGRMRYITRWGLMRNTFSENISEHSHMTAVLAHALALIRRDILHLPGPDPDRCAVAALYHDASEILTGDLPTPIKYHNPEIKAAYKEVERKVFPGYVLIKMVMTDDTWHLVRNVRGVTGFVGEASNKPIPLSEEEVLALGMEKHEIVVMYKAGDRVRISDGPLESFTGVVEEIDPEKNKVTVVVSMFGRETPVELELDQVEVVD